MLDPIAIVGAVGGLVGVASLAATRWRGDDRAARNDHQACLDKLAEHIEKADKRSEGHDLAITSLGEKLELCHSEHAKSREHVQVLMLEMKQVQRSIVPQPRKGD